MQCLWVKCHPGGVPCPCVVSAALRLVVTVSLFRVPDARSGPLQPWGGPAPPGFQWSAGADKVSWGGWGLCFKKKGEMHWLHRGPQLNIPHCKLISLLSYNEVVLKRGGGGDEPKKEGKKLVTCSCCDCRWFQLAPLPPSFILGILTGHLQWTQTTLGERRLTRVCRRSALHQLGCAAVALCCSRL